MFNQDRNDESFVFNIGRRPLRAFLSRVRGPSILKSVVEIRDIRRTSGLMAFRCRRTRCVFGLPADRGMPSHPELRVRVWARAAPLERPRGDRRMQHGSECRTRSMVPGPPPVRVGVSELRRAADVFRRWALRCNLCFLNTYTCACEYSETLASRVSQALEARRITDLQHSRKLLLTPPDQSRATAISRWTTCCPIRIGRWKQP